MIHGTQVIKLTSDSVREAIEDWLQKHLMEGTTIKVTKWEKTPNEYAGSSLTIDFEQV